MLWLHISRDVFEMWTLLDSFDKKADCEQYRLGLAGVKVDDPRNAVYQICLPDTVDPRAPKGSTR